MVTTIKITCDGVFIQSNSYLNAIQQPTNSSQTIYKDKLIRQEKLLLKRDKQYFIENNKHQVLTKKTSAPAVLSTNIGQ